MARTAELNDQELVRLTRRGDDRAFGDLVKRYQSKIYRLARRMTETDEDAEDVLQEAFVKAYRSLGQFKGESKFSTWLYRITVNLALMKLRKRRPESVSLDAPVSTDEGEVQRDFQDAGPDPLAKLESKESSAILDAAIAELPPGYRAVFILRHVEGLSTGETARILKVSVAAVKSRLHRTRIELRAKLLKRSKHHNKPESAEQHAPTKR
ncbi:MAG TPA: sigma-70 family RNA polymerase sigma factor [bacterium]|nr:sigma-70 family RNA polymerase sigma factor [bacterium]